MHKEQATDTLNKWSVSVAFFSLEVYIFLRETSWLKGNLKPLNFLKDSRGESDGE